MDYQTRLSLFLQKNNFKNKTQAENYIKLLLRELPKNTKLENEILFDLLKLHYYFYNYTPSYFTIELSSYSTYYKQQYCFYFHTEGGFHSDFSYIKCFNRNVKKLNIDATFRSLIEQQLQEHRQLYNYTNLSCSYSGIQLHNDDNTHVDHHFIHRTFKELKLMFIQTYNLTENDLSNKQRKNKRYFHNDTINDNWKTFHRQNAILQLIHKTINSQFTSGISLINTPNCSYTQLEQKPWTI